ncbi:hypothetical protein SO802_018645 [Lithocarpus litseifolius]|uniref:Uncharacterized protein n=1 Tax=Lithocarpus litseifolius TaxID=425828 RepID=A0AAW2CLF3_9ROSI
MGWCDCRSTLVLEENKDGAFGLTETRSVTTLQSTIFAVLAKDGGEGFGGGVPVEAVDEDLGFSVWVEVEVEVEVEVAVHHLQAKIASPLAPLRVEATHTLSTGQPPCKKNIVDWSSTAVWDGLGLDKNLGNVGITWSMA